MDYKEKYEMALEGIQEILGSGEDSVKMSRLQLRLQGIFPELKESEDEKWIPKEIAKYLKEKGDFRSCWLAWLEKQGEHAKFRDSIQVGDKVTRNQDGVLVNLSQLNRVAKKDEKQGDDKVEPKFREGDWVVNNNSEGVYQVTEIRDDEYCLWPLDAEIMGYLKIIDVDNDHHLWNIQDAKDGDVLAVENIIFIYERTLASHIVSYCRLINDVFESTSYARTCCEGNPYVHPATKKQRDTLMKAMTDAGYTFDFEKKVLKKIEQKPAWSGEDEKMLEYALDMIEWYSGKNENKSRLVSDWLKSLRHQSHWKPSDEQLNSLYDVLYPCDGFNREVLESLYVQLKKLREE